MNKDNAVRKNLFFGIIKNNPIIFLQISVCIIIVIVMLIIKATNINLFSYILDEYNNSIYPLGRNLTDSTDDKTKIQEISRISEMTDNSLPSFKDISMPVDEGKIRSKYNKSGGIDISVESKSNVKSLLGGKVLTVDNNSKYRDYIILEHDNGLKVLYGNCSEIKYKKGDTLSGSEVIGKTGLLRDNITKGIHIEVFYNGSELDPTTLFGNVYK